MRTSYKSILIASAIIPFLFSCSSYDELIVDRNLMDWNFNNSVLVEASNIEDDGGSIKMRPISITEYYEDESEPHSIIDKITYVEGLQVRSWTYNWGYWIKPIDNKLYYNEYEYFYTQKTCIEAEKFPHGGYFNKEFELNDGKVVKTYSHTYEYGEEGNLTKMIDNEIYYGQDKPDETILTWNNGLLNRIILKTSYFDHYLLQQYEIEYTEFPCKAWIPLETFDFSFSEYRSPFVIMQGFFGVLPKYYISSITEFLSGDTDRFIYDYTLKTTIFNYEFNECGYPIKVVVETNYDNGEYYKEYLLIEWEKY